MNDIYITVHIKQLPLLFCLLVAEVYQNWCGSCKAIENIFKKIKMETADDLLTFASVMCITYFINCHFISEFDGFFIYITFSKTLCCKNLRCSLFMSPCCFHSIRVFFILSLVHFFLFKAINTKRFF